jgi:hypothetical protein
MTSSVMEMPHAPFCELHFNIEGAPNVQRVIQAIERLVKEQKEQNKQVSQFIRDLSRVTLEDHARLGTIQKSQDTFLADNMRRAEENHNRIGSIEKTMADLAYSLRTLQHLVPESDLERLERIADIEPRSNREELNAIRVLGVKWSLYFMFGVPLVLSTFGYVDHLIKTFYWHQVDVYTINPQILQIACVGLAAVIAFGWRGVLAKNADLPDVFAPPKKKDKDDPITQLADEAAKIAESKSE